MRIPPSRKELVVRGHYFIHLSLLLIFTISSITLAAQDNCFNCNFDSLVAALPNKKTPAEKISHLRLLITHSPQIDVNPSSQLRNFFIQLLEENRKAHIIDAKPYEKWLSGFENWLKEDYRKALTELKETIELLDREKTINIALLTNMRILFNKLNAQEERYAYYKSKLDYYLVNGPVENTAACYHGIAGYYVYKGDFNLAISNYLKSAGIYKNFAPLYYNNEIGVAGYMYAEWGNDAKALQYLDLVLPLHRKARDSTNVAYSLRPLLRIALKQRDYKKAFDYANEAMVYTKNLYADDGFALAVLDKAMVFLAVKDAASAKPLLDQSKRLGDSIHSQIFSGAGKFEIDFYYYQYYKLIGDNNNAERSLQTAYAKAKESHINELQLSYLRELASVASAKGDHETAITCINRYFSLQDSLDNDLKANHIAQYENEEKEAEQNTHINALKQERALQDYKLGQRNKILIGAIVFLCLVGGLCVFIYRQLQANKKILTRLRSTQKQLVQSEKMASLGELTAGIAHEIQNPLNFINNFSEVSAELADEIDEAIKKDDFDEAINLSGMLKDNLGKIVHHGNRADSIVKSMLMHSRRNDGSKEEVDVNEMVDEFLRLSYHGLRAKDKTFNAVLETDLDPAAGTIQLVRQDIGRVLVNLFGNAFYSVNEKKKKEAASYQPTVTVSTNKTAEGITITVKDNGIGIPQKLVEKIYQPFFTTKPTGEGTGLGLSLSYDIITKGHGGKIELINTGDPGVEFQITLPAVR